MQPHPYGHPNADSHQQQAHQHAQSQHQQQQSQQQYPFAYPYHQPQYPPPYGAFPQAQAPPPPLGPGPGATPYQAYMQPYHQHQHQQHGYYQQAGSCPTHPYQQQMNPYSHQLNNQNSQYPQQQHFQQRQQYNHGHRHHQGQYYSNNNNNSNSNNQRQYQNNSHNRNLNNRHNHSQRFRHHNNHHNQRRHNNYQSQQSGRRMSKPPPSQQTPDNILARLLLDYFSNSKNNAVPSATFLNRLRQACLNTFLTLSEQNSASIPSFSILESLHHLIQTQKNAPATARPNSTTADVSESAPTNDEASDKNNDNDNNQSTKKMKVMSKSDIVSELSLDFILLCTSTPATWIYATCSGSVCNLLSITILSMFTSTTPQTDFSLGVTHFDQLVSRLQSFSDVNFWERRTFLTVKPATPFVLSIRAAISSDENASIQVDHLQCLVQKASIAHWLGVPDNVIILILQALWSSSKTLPQNVAQVLLQRLEFIPPPHDLASRLKSWLSKEISDKTDENDNQLDSGNMAEDGKAGSEQNVDVKTEAGVKTEVGAKTEADVKTDDVSDAEKNNCESSEISIVEGERQIEIAILNTIGRIRELSECLQHRPTTVSNKDGSDKSEERNQLEEAISKYPEVAVTKLGYMESACMTVLTGLSDTSVRYHHQTLSVLRTLLSAVSTTLSLIENTDQISVDSDLILQGLTFLTEENRKVNGVPALFAPVAVPLCHIICSTARTIQPVSEVKKILQCILSGRTTCAEVKNAAKKALSLIRDNESKGKDEQPVQPTDGNVVCKKDEAKIEEMNDNSGDGDNGDGGANGDVGNGVDGIVDGEGGGDGDGGDHGDDVGNDADEQLKDEGDTTVLQDDKEAEDDATRSDDNDDEEDSMKEKDR